jgi:hypothetical protein
MCFMWISEKNSSYLPIQHKVIVFITEMQSVYRAVCAQVSLIFKVIM